MIEDTTVRNLSPATQRSYVHAVAKFGRFFSRSPEKLGLGRSVLFRSTLLPAACRGRR
ncbi:phage integrase N-terminal SAM-like domain-containing protein [Acidiphilium multivorum]|uniref:phage integrase N-terminal SAM-like domain-containing protein n=1 Tax=Acidiphilium multivorum TaxID=62140 RepID=UPI001F48721F|nr:phage integrase N-terminal SAM-like domain-containing protein [Acidiphilium multivorum]